MAININSKVAECLKLQAGSRMSARDIANWIFATYPAECEEKRRTSKQDLTSDANFVQQLVAEIGGSREAIEKKFKQIRTTSDRPRLYFWTDATDAAEVAEAEGLPEIPAAVGESISKKEYDLYPLLTTFLWAEWGLYSKRIERRQLPTSRGLAGTGGCFQTS